MGYKLVTACNGEASQRMKPTFLQLAKQVDRRSVVLATAFLLFAVCRAFAQDSGAAENHAGYVPLISGGMGYLQTVNGRVTSLVPQIIPVLLVPFGTHVLLESRAPFVGFFQRRNQTTGPFTGKVFKEVEYVQVDWLADTHLIATVGRYLLPFGLYNEQLDPVWIRNLQTPPITALIGTRTSGSGDGFMLRGVAIQKASYSAQYTAYFSTRSNVNLLEATRTAGEDASLYWRKPRLEVGSSYQRFLQDRRINSAAGYVSWQPPATPLDLKAEYDYSHNGNGYWLETAYLFRRLAIPSFLRRLQAARSCFQGTSRTPNGWVRPPRQRPSVRSASDTNRRDPHSTSGPVHSECPCAWDIAGGRLVRVRLPSS